MLSGVFDGNINTFDGSVNAYSVLAVKCDIELDFLKNTNDVSIVAGNILSGKVYLKVDRTIPPASIYIDFKGAEKTQVVYTNYMDKYNRHRLCRGEREICKARNVLRNKFTETAPIEPGTYVYPFEFTLAKSLPSSMNGGSGAAGIMGELAGGESYKINYELSVLFEKEGEKKTTNVHSKVFGVASAPLSEKAVTKLVPIEAFRVTKYGTFNKGVLAVAARIHSIRVGRGEAAKIYLAARNNSTTDIERVEIELNQSNSYSAEDRWIGMITRKGGTNLAYRANVNVPGIQRGKKKEIPQGKATKKELDDFNKDLFREENMVLLPIPDGSKDSYSGSIVQVSHKIKITLVTKSSVNNPYIEIPIRIGFPPQPAVAVADVEPSAPLSVRSLPDAVIPLATAEAVSADGDAVSIPMADAVVAPMVSSRNLELGGLAVYYTEEVDGSPPPASAPPASAPPTPASSSNNADNDVSINTLLEEMHLSINDYDILYEKLQEENWSKLLSLVTADEYGSIIAHVNIDADQPRIAFMLAWHIVNSRNKSFTCEYAKVAAQNATETNRSTVVGTILSFCSDIQSNHESIRRVLSDWEQTVVEEKFEAAIRKMREELADGVSS